MPAHILFRMRFANKRVRGSQGSPEHLALVVLLTMAQPCQRGRSCNFFSLLANQQSLLCTTPSKHYQIPPTYGANTQTYPRLFNNPTFLLCDHRCLHPSCNLYRVHRTRFTTTPAPARTSCSHTSSVAHTFQDTPVLGCVYMALE